MAHRKVVCQDALKWLSSNKMLECIVTSMPEMEEVNLKIKEYESFFRSAAKACFTSMAPNGYCIFLQTDRKYHGWVDKGYWITDEARAMGFHTVWKKIALTKEVGKADLFRPTYSTMLCFTKDGNVGKLFPDVIYSGEKTYTHAFGVDSVTMCIEYAKSQGVKGVVDPFCGSGTTLAVANKLGLHAIGVDISKEACAAARKLKI
jgi:SAM-dependent methyltransferase